MFTNRNTKDELLNYIDKLETRNDILGKSKKSYVKSYEYQQATIKKLRSQIEQLENYNQYLLQENYVHMQGKIRLQDQLFERELLLHSMTSYPTIK